MKWNHILDKQPVDGSVVIEVHAPDKDCYAGEFTSHYTMGMVQYKDYGLNFEDWVATRKKDGLPPLNFWWIYAKDFPFPDHKV